MCRSPLPSPSASSHRAGYYDRSGALRDMIQNHLLQVMSVVAMEPPSAFDAESVRVEKLKVLKAVRPISVGQVDRFAVRAQYSEGEYDNARVPGYREEEDVPTDSRTETYAAVVFTLDNWRWQCVPFYVRTGMRMPRRASAITIQFRQPPHLIFAGGRDLPPSTLTIRIQPDEGISLSFSGKIPGPDVDLRSVEMDSATRTPSVAAAPKPTRPCSSTVSWATARSSPTRDGSRCRGSC